jgi:hypothetical protein
MRRFVSRHSYIIPPYIQIFARKWYLRSGANPGVNPTIASYNASVVNFYNATGSLALFENKNI